MILKFIKPYLFSALILLFSLACGGSASDSGRDVSPKDTFYYDSFFGDVSGKDIEPVDIVASDNFLDYLSIDINLEDETDFKDVSVEDISEKKDITEDIFAEDIISVDTTSTQDSVQDIVTDEYIYDVGVQDGDSIEDASHDVSSDISDASDVFIDPCSGVICENPPNDHCLNSNTLRSYSKNGFCQNGVCNYPFSDTVCKNGCSNSRCLSGCDIQPYGWDFNLTKRCVKSVCDSSSPYYFEDTSECSSSKSWLIAVESEPSLGASCPGPVNCSFLINGQDSPVRMNMYRHTGDCGDNWTVNMIVDHSAYPSPCQKDYWTWFVLMDHLQTGGGPYPNPKVARTHHKVNFNDYTPYADSSARFFVGGQWWYDGKARMIELNMVLSQWGDADPHPGLIVRFDNKDFEFIALDASYWGLDIQKGIDTSIDIPWGQILQDSISNGWLAQPTSWNNVATTSYFIG
ncbi:MAG: hypothetical protein N2746_06730, partial [Deltaproteobacteria bacterium]|nr:hypothetical protein [Deltaproteobacteria bacterium]